MVIIKGRIIDKPRVGARPIYKIRNDDKSSNIPGPLLRGKSGGRLKYVVGAVCFSVQIVISITKPNLEVTRHTGR